MEPDRRLLTTLQEQEQSAEDTLLKIHTDMVLTGKLEPSKFNEIVYLTGLRAKF